MVEGSKEGSPLTNTKGIGRWCLDSLLQSYFGRVVVKGFKEVDGEYSRWLLQTKECNYF